MRKKNIFKGIILVLVVLVSFFLYKKIFCLTLKVKPAGRKIILQDKKISYIKTFYISYNNLIIRDFSDNLYFFKKKRENKYVFKTKIVLNRNLHNLEFHKTIFTFISSDTLFFYNIYPLKLYNSLYLNNLSDTNSYVYLPKRYLFDSLLLFVKGYFTIKNIQELNIYNLKSNKILKVLKIINPRNVDGHLYLLYTNLKDNNLYFSNRLSNYIYRYNLKTQKLDSTLANSNIIDSIPIHTYKEFFSPRYVFIKIDTINKYIYRYYWSGEPFYFGAVIIDLKSFEKVGEFVFTKDDVVPVFSGKNIAIGLINKNFYLLNFKFVPVVKSLWIKRMKSKIYHSDIIQKSCSIKQEQIENDTAKINLYLRALNVKDSNKLYLLIPAEFSCPSCVEYTYIILQANYNLLRHKLKVIWIGDVGLYKSINFSFIRDSSFVILDTNKLFYQFFKLKAYNPILLEFEHDTLNFIKQYKPDEIKNLIIDIATRIKHNK